MEEKKKLLCSLISLVIILSMAVVLLSTVAEASPATEIWDWYDLDAIRNNLDGDYILMNDLDSTTAGYTELASPTANEGKGWEPIGTQGDPFSGTFDGRGHKICDLYIWGPAEFVGLFGFVSGGGVLEDIGMLNVAVTGYQYVGGLVGESDGTVSDCYSTGNVTGDTWVGGLIGRHFEGTVSNCFATSSVTGVGDARYIGGLIGENDGSMSNCYATGNVTGSFCVGGLVGGNYYNINSCYAIGNVTGGTHTGGLMGANCWGTVIKCYAAGNVTGYESVGGLVGENYDSTVSSCFATGNVTSSYSVGGLVGENYGSTVSNCYATGSVTGSQIVGGLVGTSSSVSTVSNCYATGSVTGSQSVGGLVGSNSWSTVTNCYAIGNVNVGLDVGGLVGLNDYGIVINSFWDTETSGQATSAGGTGKNTTEMQDIATFSGATWDIIAVDSGETNPAYIWNIVDDESYPFLTTGKTGDVNSDDQVNVLDMVLIGQHWGQAGSPGWIPEDVMEDGVINVLDMIIIGQHWTG
jgi:hypothetical protein